MNFAGEGMSFYLWGRMAEPGETAWDVGRRRARRDQGAFSWRNATVIERHSSLVACLIGYALPNEPEPLDLSQTPAMFVPLEELEQLAAKSWYVNVLATYPDHRGRGHGTLLLGLLGRLAAGAGRRRTSIIVADTNAGASRRLYERCGFREIAPPSADGQGRLGRPRPSLGSAAPGRPMTAMSRSAS